MQLWTSAFTWANWEESSQDFPALPSFFHAATREENEVNLDLKLPIILQIRKPTWHLAEGRKSKVKCSLSFGLLVHRHDTFHIVNWSLQPSEVTRHSLGMVHGHGCVHSSHWGIQSHRGSWANSQKIAPWSFAEGQIKILKFACKFPALLAGGSYRHQTSCAQSGKVCQLLSVQGAAQWSRDHTHLPTALYSLELGEKRASEEVTINVVMAAIVGRLSYSRHRLEPSILTCEGGRFIIPLYSSCPERPPHFSKATEQRSSRGGVQTQLWIHSSSFYYVCIRGPADNWENAWPLQSKKDSNACMKLFGAFMYYVTMAATREN